MFEEKLNALAQRIPNTISYIETEEATKNAFVMPFIAALGYDVFNPMEVIPEFTADVGIKKGEKVDYAIKRDNEIIILVEAKKANSTLGISHSSQLFRYFSVTKARIAILTNGIHYQFFSDLEEPNKLDKKPFLEIDLLNLNENMVMELKRLTKEAFDLENMLSAASDLKFMREIRAVFEKQFDMPDEGFVKFFFSKSNPEGRFIYSAKEQFATFVKNVLNQVVKDKVQERLRSALKHESRDVNPDAKGQFSNEDKKVENENLPDSSGIETTIEELEAFAIVKAIACKLVDPDRVCYKDTQSYFNVLFDDNLRKQICRLYLHRSKKYIGLFAENRKETRYPIEKISEIYKFAASIEETVQRYIDVENQKKVESEAKTTLVLEV